MHLHHYSANGHGDAPNAVDLSCLNQCNGTFTSFPPRLESSLIMISGIPAFAGMTGQNKTQILKSTALRGCPHPADEVL